MFRLKMSWNTWEGLMERKRVMMERTVDDWWLVVWEMRVQVELPAPAQPLPLALRIQLHKTRVCSWNVPRSLLPSGLYSSAPSAWNVLPHNLLVVILLFIPVLSAGCPSLTSPSKGLPTSPTYLSPHCLHHSSYYQNSSFHFSTCLFSVFPIRP